MGKKKTKKLAWGFSSDPQNIIDKYLPKFERYILKKQWLKAEKILEELQQRLPSKKEVFECWLTLAYDKGDWQTYQQKATEYSLKYPNQPDAYLSLAGICLKNSYPLLALEALQTFCEKFPDHPEIAEVNKKIETIQTIVPKLLQDYDLEEQKALDIAILNERGRFLLESHQDTEASKIFTDLINLAPQFPPALNNLSLIRCRTGDLTEAIALGQQVLEFDPNNFQALGNLVRFYVLSGETELAQKYLNQLKALDNKVLEIWVKKAESLALFGDWSGLVELGKEAESSDVSEDLTALFWHCVAVGYANSGQGQKARQLWEKSLKINPGFEYAQKNLENIKLPPQEQKTPWAFGLNDWLSSKLKEDIRQIALDSETETEDKNKSQLMAPKIIKQNPQIINLIPILLKRGSPFDRQFAIYLATATKKPELLKALKEFAFGQEGSDQERLEVAQKLNQEGLIPSGNVKMWIKGKETEILLMAMEINDEPTVIHPPKVKELGERAVMYLRMEEAETAELLLMKALKLEPSAPDLQFNLTNAYLLQGREKEAYELLEKIREENPDYGFAALCLAKHHLKNQELEKAEEIIKTLLQKKKFNRQEFCLLCQTQIELADQQKNREVALSWLNMWKQLADEDDPNLSYWCNRLEPKSSWFKNLLSS